MSGAIDVRVEALLAACLPAWRLDGGVRRTDDGGLEIEIAGKRARLDAAPAGMPFRYVLLAEGRTRALASIAALLRAVRTLGDPDYRVAKVRITPYPVLPP